MKFTAEKNQIVLAIQNASSVAERKSTMPILANMLIKTAGGVIEFTATDLEIQVKSFASVVEIQVEGEITVSARKMAELCKSLPDNEKINFFVELGKLSVRAKSFQADLSTISAADFPQLECNEPLSTINMPKENLSKILNKTHFSMATQDHRPYLNGLLLEFKEGKISAVATDGHRLAMSTLNLSDGKKESSNIIPRRAVQELLKILSNADQDIELIVGQNFMSVNSSTFQYSSKLIEAKFPDYQKVFPVGEPSILLVNKQDLLAALNRASVLSNEKYRGVRLCLAEQALKLKTNNPEQESAEEDLDVNYSGPSFEIGFNIGYLEDALQSLDSEEAELLFYGENSSCLLKATNDELSAYVVMPMRL